MEKIKEEQSTIEHNGCMGCAYEDFEVLEEPCVNCQAAYKHDTVAYLKAKDYFEPKEEKECMKCIYSNLSEFELPCCECKYNNYATETSCLKTKDCFKSNEEKADDEIDMVNHPAHYNRDGAMECIDEMITVFGKDIVACFCLCNVWKYRYRASYKGHEEDLSKSDYYMAKYKELITERSVLGFESVMEREELEDIVKEKLDKLYTEREIKNDK